MTKKKIWFITGAGRGMGLDFARAVLAAGRAVVATGRDAERVAKAVGESGATIESANGGGTSIQNVEVHVPHDSR